MRRTTTQTQTQPTPSKTPSTTKWSSTITTFAVLILFLNYCSIFYYYNWKLVMLIPTTESEEQEQREQQQQQQQQERRKQNLQLLWSASGGRYNSNNHQQQPPIQSIRIVISHCLHDLYWLNDFTQGYDMIDIRNNNNNNSINSTSPSITTTTTKKPPIIEITIISKCGKPVIGAPPISNVIRLPNLGRCDHTYAYYLSHYTEEQEEEKKNEIIVFLKDDHDLSSIHAPGKYRTFQGMIDIASETGYACGIQPTTFGSNSISAYHFTKHLYTFHMGNQYVGLNKKKYQNISSTSSSSSISTTNETKKKKNVVDNGDVIDVDVDDVPFRSEYTNLGEWIESILPSNSSNTTTTLLPFPLTEVCYGGIFATSRMNILNSIATRMTTNTTTTTTTTTQQQQPSISSLWNRIQLSLERGNNIEEGHYMERCWAGLLSIPVSNVEQYGLLQYHTHYENVTNAFIGPLSVSYFKHLYRKMMKLWWRN